MVTPQELGRKAPYAPISAVREFFERIRNVSVPPRVDRRFLQRLNVASNNEWALLSALKFLGVVDDRGVPTHVYRQLQRTDQFQETLSHVVRTAYRDLLEAGGERMSQEDLENYFRVTSSPSQAKNAARFFRELSRLAGLTRPEAGTRGSDLPSTLPPTGPSAGPEEPAVPGDLTFRAEVSERREAPPEPSPSSVSLLEAKARLLGKLPAPRADWSAAEYKEICDRFLQMLAHLDRDLPGR